MAVVVSMLAAGWPLAALAQMQTGAVLVKASGASPGCGITLDGQAGEPCWADAPVNHVVHEYWPHPGNTPLATTRYRVQQDAENLYVLVEADDPDPAGMRYVMGRRDKIGNDQDSIVGGGVNPLLFGGEGAVLDSPRVRIEV